MGQPELKVVPQVPHRPRVGQPWDLRCSAVVMVGPKALYPSGNAEHGKDGWSIVVDDELDCVWLGHSGWWTRIGWDSVNYLRFHKASEP